MGMYLRIYIYVRTSCIYASRSVGETALNPEEPIAANNFGPSDRFHRRSYFCHLHIGRAQNEKMSKSLRKKSHASKILGPLCPYAGSASNIRLNLNRLKCSYSSGRLKHVTHVSVKLHPENPRERGLYAYFMRAVKRRNKRTSMSFSSC